MLGSPARRVPFLQTFVLAGTIFGGGAPNIEIGGRGNVLLPKQQNASRTFYFIFSKCCPPSVDHGPRLASPSIVPSLFPSPEGKKSPFPSPEGKERKRKANNPNHISVSKTHLGRWPTSMLRREAARVPSSPKIFANPQKDLAPTRSALKWPEAAMAFWKLRSDWGCYVFCLSGFSLAARSCAWQLWARHEVCPRVRSTRPHCLTGEDVRGPRAF